MSKPKSILVFGAGGLGDRIISSLATHPARGTSELTLLLCPSAIETQDEAEAARNARYGQLNVTILPGDIANASESELTELSTLSSRSSKEADTFWGNWPKTPLEN